MIPSSEWLRSAMPSHVDADAVVAGVSDQKSLLHAVFQLGARYQRELAACRRHVPLFADEDDVIPTASHR